MVKVTEVFRKAFAGEMLDPSGKVVPEIYYKGLFNQSLDPSIPESEYIPPIPSIIQNAFSEDQLNPRAQPYVSEQLDMSHFTPHEQIEYEQYVKKLSKRITRILDSHRVDPRGRHIVDVKDVNLDGEDVFRSSLIDPYILNLLKATQKVLEKNPHI